MTNFQVYKKTLSFSLVSFLVDLAVIAMWAVLALVGFKVSESATDKGLIGLLIGLVVGIIVAIIIKVFVSNTIKAGQIAMMTKGVTEDELPEKTFSEGRKIVKARFASITAFFFITGAIKGIFRQLMKTINRVATAVGGDTGNAISSAVDTAVQILLGYLCDCCLGWVFYRKELGTARAACEGSVIFFKHGKTLIRNIGRIFGMGALGLIVIGGGFFGIFYGISNLMSGQFNTLAIEVAEALKRADVSDASFLTNPNNLMLIISGILALVIYSMIHSVFIRPFILVGVLRNFTASGVKDMPTEEEFSTLNNKSPRFAKLYSQV